jgi:hypothetical protein
MDKQLNPSKKDKTIVVSAFIGMVLLGTIYGFCFAKFEYKPITIQTFTRSLGTAYQPNITRFMSIKGSVSITSSLTLSGGQSGSISLQTSPDGITYTTKQTATNNNTGGLTIGLNTIQAQTTELVVDIPPGYYYKFVSSGTSTFGTSISVDETTL